MHRPKEERDDLEEIALMKRCWRVVETLRPKEEKRG